MCLKVSTLDQQPLSIKNIQYIFFHKKTFLHNASKYLIPLFNDIKYLSTWSIDFLSTKLLCSIITQNILPENKKKCLQKKYIEWSTFKSMSTRISNKVKECTKRSHAVTNCLCSMKDKKREISVKHDARKIFMMCNNNPSKECRRKKYLGTSDKNLKITSKYLF